MPVTPDLMITREGKLSMIVRDADGSSVICCRIQHITEGNPFIVGSKDQIPLRRATFGCPQNQDHLPALILSHRSFADDRFPRRVDLPMTHHQL